MQLCLKVGLSFALALTLTTPLAARSAGVLPTGPSVGDQDLSPFYRWTGSLSRQPGHPLHSEPMPATAAPEHAGTALRILYTSTDGRWDSGVLPVSGALYLPKGSAPSQGWPLIVWAHGTVGVADSCAPSWTGSNPRDRAYVDQWLAKGYAVVAPDYQGLGGPGPHPYTLWQAEGRSVLDAARAALRLNSTIANRVVIAGQSQGSGAALGAARLAADYAPDIRVMGTIATALLPTFPDLEIPGSNETPCGSPYYHIYRMLSGSLPDGAPPVETLLTAKGKLLLDAARNSCSPRLVGEANGITMDNAFAVPVAEIDARMGPSGAMTPFRVRFPLMLGTGLADELIPASRQTLAVRAICKAGNRVSWKRYPDTKHSDTLLRSFDDAEAFARAVLGGSLTPQDCASL